MVNNGAPQAKKVSAITKLQLLKIVLRITFVKSAERIIFIEKMDRGFFSVSDFTLTALSNIRSVYNPKIIVKIYISYCK